MSETFLPQQVEKRRWRILCIYCVGFVALWVVANAYFYTHYPPIIKEVVCENNLPKYLIPNAQRAQEVTGGTIWLDGESFLKEKPSFTRQWYVFSRTGYSSITEDSLYAVYIYGEQSGAPHMIALSLVSQIPFDPDNYYGKAVFVENQNRLALRSFFWIVTLVVIALTGFAGYVIVTTKNAEPDHRIVRKKV